MITVLISGAGVAGPTLAYWLHRLGVAQPTVVERSDAVRAGGYPIDVRGVAVDVVERMGVLAQLQAAHIHSRRLRFVGAGGRQVGSVDPAAMTGSTAGRDLELPRGDLTSVIFERGRRDVEYVFGDVITGMEQGVHGVRVSFRRGAPRTFDLVVGTDGLHSNVRGLTFGAESPLRHHLGFHVAGFPVPNHLDLDSEGMIFNIPGRMAALYAVGHTDTVHGLLVHSGPDLPGDRPDHDAQLQAMEDAFVGAGWEIPRLLEAMRAAGEVYLDPVSQIRMPSWTSGRVALVGDAAYAPSFLSGQGTSLALTGAYVLAGELAAAGGDQRVALPAYERRLRGYVETNQKLALHGAGQLVPATRSGIRVRNLALRVMPLLARTNLVGGDIRRAATAIDLPDYAPLVPARG